MLFFIYILLWFFLYLQCFIAIIKTYILFYNFYFYNNLNLCKVYSYRLTIINYLYIY